MGGVGGVDNGSRRDLAVHVRNGRINSEGAFRIPVGMGCRKSVHGRNMAGDSSGEPQIVEIRGDGVSGRHYGVWIIFEAGAGRRRGTVGEVEGKTFSTVFFAVHTSK